MWIPQSKKFDINYLKELLFKGAIIINNHKLHFVRQKNRRKHKHIELEFFKANLHFVTSNQKNFIPHKQYLLSLLYSRNAKKTRTNESILHIFYSAWKESTHESLKISVVKNRLMWSVEPDSMNVLFHVTTGRYCFS